MKKIISPILVFLAAVTWGISGYFVRETGNYGFSTFEIVFIRFLTASIFASLFFVIFDRKVFKIKLKDVWCFFGTGSIGAFGCSLFYFLTMKSASLGTACILMYTSPIVVITLSVLLFKEKLTVIKVVGLITTFIGCILCSYETGGFELSLPSFLIGLCSGICYGLYSIFSRFAMNKGYKSETIILYSFIFACLASTFFVPYKEFSANLNYLDDSLFYFLGLGLISTVAPYTLYTLGLKNMENGKASIIACFEIVASIFVGLIMYNEVPSFIKIIGIIVVFASVIALNIIPQKQANLEPTELINN